MPKKIFISHSHKDELFIDFVNNFLNPTALKNFRNDEKTFTSDKERVLGISTGQNSRELLDDAANSELFICCVSEHYKKSEFCVLENGAAYEKYRKENNRLFPVLSHGYKHSDTLASMSGIIHANLGLKDSLKDLHNRLKDLFPHAYRVTEKEYNQELDKWYAEYNDKVRKYHNSKSVKLDLFDKVVESFPDRSDVQFPVTVFCERKEYEDLCIKSAEKANHLLVWTLSKSPLLVDEAYKNTNTFLTKYDERFRDTGALNRYRLVIFDDYNMTREYLNCDNATLNSINSALGTSLSKQEVESRKKCFEDSNGNGMALYFTTKQKIKEWYRNISKPNVKDIPDYFDYEFGFMASSTASTASFGFTSGFHSNTGGLNKNLKKHMTFYPGVIDIQLYSSFEERNDLEYYIYYDIPIQIKFIKHFLDSNSELRKNYIISNTITNQNIALLQ